MKAKLLLVGLITGLTASLWAGPDVIIKQRAKELVNQNNVRQGVTPPTQPAAPPASASQSGEPAPQPRALAALQSDLAAVKPGSQPSVAEKQKMTRDLLAMAQTGAKPTSASAAKLVDDVTAALSSISLSSNGRARFVQELDAVLNPGKYPQAKMQAIFDDVQAIFQADGLPRKDAVRIADSVKTLAAEVQNPAAH
jgi:hypothetical protein